MNSAAQESVGSFSRHLSHETQHINRRSPCIRVSPPSNTIAGCTQGGGDVECDAAYQKKERDAPGQNCAYIPPGDHADEYYRLATFAKYPNNVPVNAADMAAGGLYYSGFKDRVKCYSCGVSVENWVLGDDGMDKKWHTRDCKLTAGHDPFNRRIKGPKFQSLLRKYKGLSTMPGSNNLNNTQPKNTATMPPPPVQSNGSNGISSRHTSTPMETVTSNMARFQLNETTQPPVRIAQINDHRHREFLQGLNLRSEADRRKTFEKWPSYPAPLLPSQLAKDGFFYLGNTDRTQCFSCSGILRNWASTDNVHEQHRIHLPACRIVRNLETGNLSMTESQRNAADEADRRRMQEQQSTGEPPDPTFEEQRLLANHFPCIRPANGHMSSMQARIASFDSRWPATVRAPIEHLARAGFYYLGESDKTKCFYCNGGLQNWDPNDEPWTEHAKWFPGCEYVIRRKGTEFVRRLAEEHPNLNRPFIRNSVSYDIPPENIGSRSRSTINIEQVLSMGFTQNEIDDAIQSQESRGGYGSTEELINDLIERSSSQSSTAMAVAAAPAIAPNANAGNKRGGVEEAATAIKKTRTSSPVESSITEGSEIMAESLKAMEEEILCKKCKANRACIVFTPCGHLSVCEDCSKDIKKCLICKSKVQSTVKVFRA